ncbi:hypothetical protein [Paenibacillus macquariensis]|uniref:Uncharacterized protein n=1 Tax=Paenibacillus macquariensis TaxID=948756 RepID=A0ABY1KB73_9BACL|nr:hypothetical protein [Paenibacillus macquariensis]MEC0089537.1 hypothetical protein [Paenibacillus macquariensis]SIR53410.1 hypothetical protein SAMN05421578_11790 [Paenibacillus macquariensis]
MDGIVVDMDLERHRRRLLGLSVGQTTERKYGHGEGNIRWRMLLVYGHTF